MPDLDEDVLRQLMLRSTDDLFAPPAAAAAAIRHQRRRRMRTRVLGVAGTAAAAGLAIGTLASSSGSGARPAQASPGAGARTAQASRGGSAKASQAAPAAPTAAHATLLSLSVAAAKTPRPSGRYVILTQMTYTVDSASAQGGKGSAIGPTTDVINTVTGGGLEYQDITIVGLDQPKPPSVLIASPGNNPTNAQLDAMPTDPKALRAFLLAQWKQQNQPPAPDANFKTPIGWTTDAHVFDQAANLLFEPNLSPALRAAAYEVLAATPGVIVNKDATDSSGRPAVEISRLDSDGYTDIEAFEDPATGATFETTWIGSGELDEDLYQSITYANAIPPNPYKAHKG
jgi:hypothetical protein